MSTRSIVTEKEPGQSPPGLHWRCGGPGGFLAVWVAALPEACADATVDARRKARELEAALGIRPDDDRDTRMDAFCNYAMDRLYWEDSDRPSQPFAVRAPGEIIVIAIPRKYGSWEERDAGARSCEGCRYSQSRAAHPRHSTQNNWPE